jgi:Right handed beta helix region
MNRRSAVAGLLLMIGMQRLPAADNVTEIRDTGHWFFGRDTRLTVSKPGHYRLMGDLWLDGTYFPVSPEGPALKDQDSVILMIETSDVTMDFNGHQLGGDAGIAASIATPELFSSRDFSRRDTQPSRITLRNGIVDAERGSGRILFDGVEPSLVVLSDHQNVNSTPVRDAEHAKLRDELNRRGLQWDSQKRLSSADRYPRRDIVIENMRITTAGAAIEIQGAGTVIRNSVIKTDSNSALVLHGPGARIENNLIVVDCQRGVRESCKPADAPIRLRMGDGAVIRNNVFVLSGATHQRIVSVFDTAGSITLEGNTFIGLDKLEDAVSVQSGTAPQLTARNNLLDNGIVSKLWSRYARRQR